MQTFVNVKESFWKTNLWNTVYSICFKSSVDLSDLFFFSSIIAETIRTTTVPTDFHIHTTVVPVRIIIRTTTTDLLTPVTASISLKSQLNFCLLIFEVNIFRSAFLYFTYFSPQFLNITKTEDSYTVQNYNPFPPIPFATSALLWPG